MYHIGGPQLHYVAYEACEFGYIFPKTVLDSRDAHETNIKVFSLLLVQIGTVV